jgi:hypothetical protein
MIVHSTIEFDRLEHNTLLMVAPSIGIAFPTDASGDIVIEELTARAAKEAKRVWPGRSLKTVCTQRAERFNYNMLYDACEALTQLISVLTEQAQVSYWEREIGRGASPLGTDPCEVLAEARQMQLRNACEARPLILQALRVLESNAPREIGHEA